MYVRHEFYRYIDTGHFRYRNTILDAPWLYLVTMYNGLKGLLCLSKPIVIWAGEQKYEIINPIKLR